MSDGLNKIATVSEAKNSVKYGIRPRPSLLVFDLLRSDHSIFLKENLPSRSSVLTEHYCLRPNQDCLLLHK